MRRSSTSSILEDVSSSSTSSSGKSVSFGEIQVREHERILGASENTFGLALGWAYTDSEAQDLDQHECKRDKQRRGWLGFSPAIALAPSTDFEKLAILKRYGFTSKVIQQCQSMSSCDDEVSFDSIEPKARTRTIRNPFRPLLSKKK